MPAVKVTYNDAEAVVKSVQDDGRCEIVMLKDDDIAPGSETVVHPSAALLFSSALPRLLAPPLTPASRRRVDRMTS